MVITNSSPARSNAGKWILIAGSAILLIAFFIPWVSWDKNSISGADMPLGKFFSVSEQNYGLANPFPQFNRVFFIVWIIPVLAGVTLLLALLNKKTEFVAILTGMMALGHATIYFLFSKY